MSAACPSLRCRRSFFTLRRVKGAIAWETAVCLPANVGSAPSLVVLAAVWLEPLILAAATGAGPGTLGGTAAPLFV